MKTIITLFLLQCTVLLSNAQVIYYDSSWNTLPSKTDAFYYREVSKTNDTFFVKDYYISGQLQMSGSYLDSACTTKHGPFVYYYSNGQKSSEGTYKEGKEQRDWNYWDTNGEKFVETMPQFQGGIDAMIKYLQQNVKYPKDARKKNIEGRVVVQFIVGADGSISQVDVVRSVYPSLDAEAIRVVSKMPKWEPGTQQGKPVFVKFTLPISFKLN